MMNIYLREMHVMSRETAVVFTENNGRNERRLYRRINEQGTFPSGIISVTYVMGKIEYAYTVYKCKYNHMHLYLNCIGLLPY